MTTQSEMWKGEFGDEYIDRNQPTTAAIRSRVRAYATILDHIGSAPLASILECGANLGLNLRALRRLVGAELFAIEPNERAGKIAVDDGVLPAANMRNATLESLPFEDDSIDLVFTSGVLIHVPPEQLDRAYQEMHRVARRFVLSLEYFSKSPETIRYRGHSELLFKRDFGAKWLELFPDIEPVAQGFFWEKTTGLDDITWWLFRK